MKFSIHISRRTMNWFTFLFCDISLLTSLIHNATVIIQQGKPAWSLILMVALYVSTMIYVPALLWPRQWNRFVVWVTQPYWSYMAKRRNQ